VDAMSWEQFLVSSDEAARQRAAEVIFRFVQGAIYRVGVFNGDPHPGNYLFGHDGTVTFIDFGLVKRWEPGEFEALIPIIAPLFERDARGVVSQMEKSGFLLPGNDLDPDSVLEYVSAPYKAYFTDTFTFTEDFTQGVIRGLLEVGGPNADVMHKLTMPPSFVILDRVVWGMSALLGRLGARNQWRAILDEYRLGRPPVTPLGLAEQEWLQDGARPHGR